MTAELKRQTSEEDPALVVKTGHLQLSLLTRQGIRSFLQQRSPPLLCHVGGEGQTGHRALVRFS